MRSSRSPPQEFQALTKQIFGGDIGWLPWQRPGFELGLKLEAFVKETQPAKGVVLESHGLFTWGDDAKACYELTLDDHQQGDRSGSRANEGKPIFGGQVQQSLPRGAPGNRRPADAGNPRPIGKAERKLGHFDDSDAVLEFVNCKDLRRWPRSAPPARTTSCAPRSARWSSISIRPSRMSTPRRRPRQGAGGLPRRLRPLLRALQARQFARHARRQPGHLPDPGVGMLSFAKDKATARIAGEFYVNAINVMRGARTRPSIYGPAGAGSLRHRILAARRSQAAAHAEAEEPGRQGRLGHRRRRRHRPATAAAAGEGACVVLADIDAGSAERHAEDFAKRSARTRAHRASSTSPTKTR
jgi:hypothetical protein